MKFDLNMLLVIIASGAIELAKLVAAIAIITGIAIFGSAVTHLFN